MASTSRTFARALRTNISSSRLAPHSRCIAQQQRQWQRQQGWRRSYSSQQEPASERYPGNPNAMLYGAGVLAIGGIAWGVFEKKPEWFGQPPRNQNYIRSFEEYQQVYDEIAKRLVEFDEYDDGSYGPVLLRLAWHASGTYDAETKTGGSNGATMRFAPEGDHGANAGLLAARNFLDPVKEKFPWITYSDLWILAGVCAIQEMQGPKIPYRMGRSDRDVSFCTPDGRLPDASKGSSHLRAIFGRMGFDDREIVALSGAHALGRCHTDRSGYDGPWTFSPTTLTNDYFKLLVEDKWAYKKWDGPKQFEDVKTKTLMMLPTDMELVKDQAFKPFTDAYAKDQGVFFKDFSDAVVRLFEFGVPFEQPVDQRWVFKSSFD